MMRLIVIAALVSADWRRVSVRFCKTEKSPSV